MESGRRQCEHERSAAAIKSFACGDPCRRDAQPRGRRWPGRGPSRDSHPSARRAEEAVEDAAALGAAGMPMPLSATLISSMSPTSSLPIRTRGVVPGATYFTALPITLVKSWLTSGRSASTRPSGLWSMIGAAPVAVSRKSRAHVLRPVRSRESDSGASVARCGLRVDQQVVRSAAPSGGRMTRSGAGSNGVGSRRRRGVELVAEDLGPAADAGERNPEVVRDSSRRRPAARVAGRAPW